jgi:sporulation integral membrane protein YtvI
MNVKQKQDFLINVAFGAFVLFVLYLFFKYVFPITIPFLLGYCVAFMIVKISKKFGENFKILRILLTIIFYGTIGLLIGLGVLKGYSALYNLVSKLPDLYENEISPLIKDLYDKIIKIVEQLDPDIKNTIQILVENLLSALQDVFGAVSEAIIGFVLKVAKSVPSLFLSTLAMIISTFFFVVDYEKMVDFIHKYLPQKWKGYIKSVKYYTTNTLFVVIRSYLLIMLMTFTELTLLFFILGIKNGPFIASIIAIFDIMPILGTGGIMIPWAIISLIRGKFILGIKLFVIYIIVTVVRNYMEPKIVGAQLGLHPIISLVSMFIGLRLFGILGMFGVPVSISFFWKKIKERKN